MAASVMTIAAATTIARLARVRSTNAPSGVVTAIPAMPPMVMTTPISAGDQCRCSQEHAEERPETGLHVGHEEIGGAQREQGPAHDVSAARSEIGGRPASQRRAKNEECAAGDQRKTDHMVPGDRLLQIDHREHARTP